MEKLNGGSKVEEKEEKPPMLPARKQKIKIKQRLPEPAIVVEQVPEENFTCTDCNKSFVTKKGVDGHMRIHSNGRGKRPRCSVTTSSYHHHHLDHDHILVSCGDMKVEEDEELLMEGAAYGLMLLANGGDRSKIVFPPKFDDEVRVPSWSRYKKPRTHGYDGKGENQMVEESSSTSLMRKKARTCIFDDNEYKNQKVSMDVGDDNNSKKMKIIKSYTCGICCKNFGTPQALGGHTSSAHGNKNSIKNVVPEQGKKVDQDDVVLDEICELTLSTRGAPISHVCEICNKALPTGQALGGHKRLHYQPPVAVNVVVEAQDQARNSKLCLLDLNEIPADDSEELMVMDPS